MVMVEAATEIGMIQSVGKAMTVIETLMRAREPLSARAIAELAGINRTTTHRLLRALMRLGWVEKPPAEPVYRLSIRFLALAQVATQGRNFLAELRPGLERLSRLSRETIHLGVRDGSEVLHIDRIDSLERVGVASKIGSRAALHTTGLGKAILAAESPAQVEEYIAFAVKETEQPLSDPEAFRREIAVTRERGYSIDDEDDSVGVRCLGVAVLGVGGAPLFAISITGPSPRFTRRHVLAYAPEAIDTARALSRELGWDGERPG
jgi:IclR family KDG regulon transcriptional repressor